jgi:hypothetical protein
MLELDDIQHILLTCTPAITGRYEFLAFDKLLARTGGVRSLSFLHLNATLHPTLPHPTPAVAC